MPASASRSARSASRTCVILERASPATVSVEPETAVCSRYPTSALCATSSAPASTSREPHTARSNVDFPHPFAPTRPTTSPGSTRRFAPTSRSRSPTVTRTSRRTIIAPAVSPRGTSFVSEAASTEASADAARAGAAREARLAEPGTRAASRLRTWRGAHAGTVAEAACIAVPPGYMQTRCALSLIGCRVASGDEASPLAGACRFPNS